jgi:hypothetical protein
MVRLYWEAEAIRPPFYFRWFLKPYSPDFFGEVNSIIIITTI